VITELNYAKARVKVRTAASLQIGCLAYAPRKRGSQLVGPGSRASRYSIIAYGDQSQAVVIPAIYHTAYPAPADKRTIRRTIYQDGTVNRVRPESQ
jgi:phage baseplate assembly protein gpV